MCARTFSFCLSLFSTDCIYHAFLKRLDPTCYQYGWLAVECLRVSIYSSLFPRVLGRRWHFSGAEINLSKSATSHDSLTKPVVLDHPCSHRCNVSVCFEGPAFCNARSTRRYVIGTELRYAVEWIYRKRS